MQRYVYTQKPLKPIIMQIFNLASNRGDIFDWDQKPALSYKGIIIPCASLYSLHGGFGDFVFQNILRARYSLWFNHYQCGARLKTHATADVQFMELSIFLQNAAAYTFTGDLGRTRQKRGQFNIFNSTGMDCYVQIEKDAIYSTLDIHPKIELAESLYKKYPELLEPLLNAAITNRDYTYLKNPYNLTYPMIQLTELILDLSQSPVIDYFLLDLAVVTLFGLALLCKLESKPDKINYERKLEIRQELNRLAQMLIDEKKFRNLPFYAGEVYMSITSLQKHFKSLYGMGVEEFWRNEKMRRTFQAAVYSNMHLEDIAEEFGFSDGNALSKAFKKYYRQSPSFFKELIKHK